MNDKHHDDKKPGTVASKDRKPDMPNPAGTGEDPMATPPNDPSVNPTPAPEPEKK